MFRGAFCYAGPCLLSGSGLRIGLAVLPIAQQGGKVIQKPVLKPCGLRQTQLQCHGCGAQVAWPKAHRPSPAPHAAALRGRPGQGGRPRFRLAQMVPHRLKPVVRAVAHRRRHTVTARSRPDRPAPASGRGPPTAPPQSPRSAPRGKRPATDNIRDVKVLSTDSASQITLRS